MGNKSVVPRSAGPENTNDITNGVSTDSQGREATAGAPELCSEQQLMESEHQNSSRNKGTTERGALTLESPGGREQDRETRNSEGTVERNGGQLFMGIGGEL